ncbi:hypothetical protein [Deinococcus radiophilus]|uniref:Uncharacterized protein n=1 Tax=Deinococcus radiophilus TaxID=32062 RepID=A0A3S0IGB0_9DEIO|nr:hypothetical protein [Deinococcus radiophilus]RTR21605.1 hypothetical protein EJ104_12950 [Deinococcus radiophilus]UFA51886.1 hypothetical protein LMT64_12670 [Deinococcus radiophilus]
MNLPRYQYFTRKRSDIDWTPVRENEIEELERSYRRLVLAALHGGVRLGGSLIIDWPMEPGASAKPEERERRLPASFAKASRMLAFENRDASRPPRSLNNAATHLQTAIDTRQRQIIGSAADPAEGRRQYIRWLYEQLQTSSIRAVIDWNDQEVQGILKLWLTEDPQLRQALLEVFPVDRALVDGLYKAAGEPLPKSRRAEKDGFYCKVCGGWVGETYEDVIQNGLLCSFHPEDETHPFGRPYSIFG